MAAELTLAEVRADNARMDAAIARLKNKPKDTVPPPDRTNVLGGEHVPGIRRGENTMTSRGFSYARAAALACKMMEPSQCTVEVDLCSRLGKDLNESQFKRAVGTTITVPLDPVFLMGNGEFSGVIDTRFALEMKSIITAGTHGGEDKEWVEWAVKKGYLPDTLKVGGQNQSWLQQDLGGALIPYPEMGPLVPLLRNAAAVMAAGAQVIPLPPSGRISFPRQTAPTTGYWVGEGASITQSQVNTDQLTLSAKKVGCFLQVNNELIRFGGPIVEQMFRNDMTTTLGLTLDYALLQAEGSDNVPAGLIGYPGVTTFTPTTVATNGNTLAPQDMWTFIGQIRSNNGKFQGWILYPTLMYAMLGKRAGVAAVGDNGGLFLFDITRGFNDKMQEVYRVAGYPMYDSANVPNGRAKGNATNLTTLYGGQWDDYRIGMFGTIEFAQADQGTPAFQQDQSQVRALLSVDGAPLHPGVFGYADSLTQTVGS